ncbi:hypothetical protein ACFVH6_30380 [Spirillospora sp. NPDC127200]
MADLFPPADLWPVLQPPDCPNCQTTADVVFLGPADRLDGGEATVWHCRTCPADWAIPATWWPVSDGPDCPTCHTSFTCWAAIDPDHLGDLWLCEHAHEFVVTPEGLIVLPKDAA